MAAVRVTSNAIVLPANGDELLGLRCRSPAQSLLAIRLAVRLFGLSAARSRLSVHFRVLSHWGVASLRISFILLLCSLNPAAAGEDVSNLRAPVIYDAMTFAEKPNLGLSEDVGFIYEWEATHLAPSPRKINVDAFSRVVVSRYNRYKYLVIDIESLKSPEEDPIAIKYVELAKATAAPGVQVAWWNTGPHYIRRGFDVEKSRDDWNKRMKLDEANDFLIFGSYFLGANDTVELWAGRELPRIVEMRRRLPNKPLFVTLSPHIFSESPWGYVSGKLFGETMDLLAKQPIDGIVIWSVENSGRGQRWDESWEWVGALRKRIGRDGRYRAP